MKKITLISIIILISITSLVKNSTKDIEDKIFSINESIRSLKVEFDNEVLEYNYLSSPKMIIQHQSEYFENDLIKIDITKIKNIEINEDYLETTYLQNKIQIND
jgi:hypothetical protein